MRISECDIVRVIADIPEARIDNDFSQRSPQIGDLGAVILVHAVSQATRPLSSSSVSARGPQHLASGSICVRARTDSGHFSADLIIHSRQPRFAGRLNSCVRCIMSKTTAWGYLHDGSLDRAEGTVPGDLFLSVSIPYLRRAFQPEGDGFVLLPRGCTLFQLEDHDGAVLADPHEIAERSPELLSIVSEAPLTIYTTLGTLTLAYRALELALDTGPDTTRCVARSGKLQLLEGVVRAAPRKCLAIRTSRRCYAVWLNSGLVSCQNSAASVARSSERLATFALAGSACTNAPAVHLFTTSSRSETRSGSSLYFRSASESKSGLSVQSHH